MQRFIFSMALLGVLFLTIGAAPPPVPSIPDLRGQWTGYNAQGQNIGVNKIAQDGQNITFHHPNGQVTSGAYIPDQRSLYVPVWGSTGIISADGCRIDFKGGSMDSTYFVRTDGGSKGTEGVQTGSGNSLHIRAEFEPKKGLRGASDLDYTCGHMNRSGIIGDQKTRMA